MPFRLPKPRYDAALVEEIESYQDMWYQTEIIGRHSADVEPADGLDTVIARGKYTNRSGKVYVRPMLQVLPAGFSGHPNRYRGCPGCDDWSRTAQCATHPERPSEHILAGEVDLNPVVPRTPMTARMHHLIEDATQAWGTRCEAPPISIDAGPNPPRDLVAEYEDRINALRPFSITLEGFFADGSPLSGLVEMEVTQND